jgi:hypothetical protein
LHGSIGTETSHCKTNVASIEFKSWQGQTISCLCDRNRPIEAAFFEVA